MATKPKIEDPELDELEEEEIEDDEDDEDEDAGKDEATLRAELKESRAALVAAKGTSTKAFAKRRELKGELARLNGLLAAKPTTSTDDKTPKGADDTDARIAAARSEGTTAADARAIKSAARAHLAGAGVTEEEIGDAVRLLDLDDLEIEDDGSIEGLGELVVALKVRHPSLFGTRKPRRKIAGPGDTKGGGGADTRSASQRQADAILGT